MSRYLIAQLGDDVGANSRVISTAALHAMQTPPVGSPYGMGWLVDTVARTRILWHTGAVGNYHGDMLLIPSPGWGVVQLANVNNFLLEDQLSAGIEGFVALLLGYSPPARTWRSFRMTYAIITAICVAWLAWRVAQLVELRRWRGALGRVSDALPVDGSVGSRHRASGALIDRGIALGLALGAPLLLGSPVSTLRWFVPDLTAWLSANTIAALAIMTARLTLAMVGQETAAVKGTPLSPHLAQNRTSVVN